MIDVAMVGLLAHPTPSSHSPQMRGSGPGLPGGRTRKLGLERDNTVLVGLSDTTVEVIRGEVCTSGVIRHLHA